MHDCRVPELWRDHALVAFRDDEQDQHAGTVKSAVRLVLGLEADLPQLSRRIFFANDAQQKGGNHLDPRSMHEAVERTLLITEELNGPLRNRPFAARPIQVVSRSSRRDSACPARS